METGPQRLELLIDLEQRQEDLLRRIEELDRRVEQVLADFLGTAVPQPVREAA